MRSFGRSRAIGLLCAIPFLGLTALCLLLYPRLVEWLGLAHHRALNVAFHLGFAALLLSLLLFASRAARLIVSTMRVARAWPWLSLLFLVNASIGGLLVLKLFTFWGVAACLLAAALLLARYALVSGNQRDALLLRVVRLSPISCMAVYLLLAAGELFLRFQPTLSGTGGGGNPALAKIYSGLYAYNSDGIRDLEVERPATPGEFRILALGDSFTFGQGVAFGDCFSRQLQRELRRTVGSGRIRVINAGRPAANTDWEYRFLEGRGALYEPDLVLVQFYANDIEAREYAVDPKSREERHTWMSPINRFFSKSYVLFFLRDHFDRSVEEVRRLVYSDVPPDYLSALADRARRNGPGWRRCLESFEKFSDWSREHDTPLVVSLWPHPGEQHEGVTEIHARVGAHLSRLGLPYVDLRAAIDRIEPARQIAHTFDHHPSGAYHRAAAQRMARFLNEQGLIPR